MSYAKEILNGGEQIVYQARMSLWNFAVQFVGLGILLAAYAGTTLAHVPMVGLYLLAVALFSGARVAIVYYGTELVLTDARLIYKSGFISRYTNEINYKKIESIQVSQSVMGRLLDFGTIRVGGVGTDGILVRGIADPIAFRKAFAEISGKVSPAV